jgi:hypothetical protein
MITIRSIRGTRIGCTPNGLAVSGSCRGARTSEEKVNRLVGAFRGRTDICLRGSVARITGRLHEFEYALYASQNLNHIGCLINARRIMIASMLPLLPPCAGNTLTHAGTTLSPRLTVLVSTDADCWARRIRVVTLFAAHDPVAVECAAIPPVPLP